MLTRHQVLAELHAILRPEVYLEVGVQTGASLALAEKAGMAIGVEPDLRWFDSRNARPNQKLYGVDYFDCVQCERPKIDLAFIDGSHLFEDALWDFIHIEMQSHPDTVVVFDDVLPYGQAIAERVQPPGDWTGDVWKLIYILAEHRPDLDCMLVDASATGLLVVTGFSPTGGWIFDTPVSVAEIIERWTTVTRVPDDVITRGGALRVHSAESFLDYIAGK